MFSQKKIITKLLSSAGIIVNGDNPWDIRINNEKFYKRAWAGGSIGLGETYMDKWWDCDRLDDFFFGC